MDSRSKSAYWTRFVMRCVTLTFFSNSQAAAPDAPPACPVDTDGTHVVVIDRPIITRYTVARFGSFHPGRTKWHV